MISISSTLILIVAVILALLIRNGTKEVSKWHEGDDWNRFFRVYDAMAEDQFGNCDSKQLESRFGTTQVHVCGNSNGGSGSDKQEQTQHNNNDDMKTPVFLIHGLASQSLLFGNWLVPKLAETRFTVAIDSLCDVGRSYPKNGDPKSCPQTPDELSEWIIDIADRLDLPKQKKINLVGYSYGGFVAAKVAIDNPDRFGKVALIAPAAVFGPVSMEFIVVAIGYSMLDALLPTQRMKERLSDWYFSYLIKDPNTMSINEWPAQLAELRLATQAVGTSILAVPPEEFSEEDLIKLQTQHPTLLILGRHDIIMNATGAAQRVNSSSVGIDETSRAQVIMYEDAGHLMCMEHPRQEIADHVASFLD